MTSTTDVDSDPDDGDANKKESDNEEEVVELEEEEGDDLTEQQAVNSYLLKTSTVNATLRDVSEFINASTVAHEALSRRTSRLENLIMLAEQVLAQPEDFPTAKSDTQEKSKTPSRNTTLVSTANQQTQRPQFKQVYMKQVTIVWEM